MASSLAEALFKLGDRRRQLRQDAIDQAYKMAELQQAGYDIQQQPGRFGGMFGGGQMVITPRQQTLPKGFVMVQGKAVQDPSYFNREELAYKSKLEADEEERSFRNMQRLFGGGSSDIDAEIAAIKQELATLPPEEETMEDFSTMTDEQLKAIISGGV